MRWSRRACSWAWACSVSSGSACWRHEKKSTKEPNITFDTYASKPRFARLTCAGQGGRSPEKMVDGSAVLSYVMPYVMEA